jgi:hypothetical protein
MYWYGAGENPEYSRLRWLLVMPSRSLMREMKASDESGRLLLSDVHSPIWIAFRESNTDSR